MLEAGQKLGKPVAVLSGAAPRWPLGKLAASHLPKALERSIYGFMDRSSAIRSTTETVTTLPLPSPSAT
jgi:hypothetical protein